jgi:hypothetical protein
MHVHLNPARVRSVGYGMCLANAQQFKMLNVLHAPYVFLYVQTLNMQSRLNLGVTVVVYIYIKDDVPSTKSAY